MRSLSRQRRERLGAGLNGLQLFDRLFDQLLATEVHQGAGWRAHRWGWARIGVEGRGFAAQGAPRVVLRFDAPGPPRGQTLGFEEGRTEPEDLKANPS